MAQHKFFLRFALIALLILGLGITACGKRGDPYRPSDITTFDGH